MERRGQEIPNSMGYNPPQIIQETPVKLPLAPILSRRGNPMLNSTRRGTSIFSPTQTLDHHYNPPHKDSNPDGDPPPTTTTASNSKNHPPQAADSTSTGTNTSSIRYRECLKNHAANMGGHVVDGCGEFMASGEEGTQEALKCAACDCHRNFHRKQVEGEQSHHYPYNPNNNNNHSTQLLHSQIPSSAPLHHKLFPTPPTMVNFAGGAAAESSSEDLNMFQSSGSEHAAAQPSKKRFRTKFSQDQKSRMHELASKMGWRIQKQYEQEVQQFCTEVGVKRQVFKVWMHNNKQAIKKRQSD